jgi:hypothetical protein
VDCFAADGFETLNEENRRKAAPDDLVGDIPFVLGNAYFGQLFCQIGVAEVSALKLSLQQTLDLGLPTLRFLLGFQEHTESPDLVLESL